LIKTKKVGECCDKFRTHITASRTVAKRSSIGWLYVCAGGRDILQIW